MSDAAIRSAEADDPIEARSKEIAERCMKRIEEYTRQFAGHPVEGRAACVIAIRLALVDASDLAVKDFAAGLKVL